MFKNVIFDWSGVIKDSVQSHVWVVNKMMEQFGGDMITLQDIKENWEQPYMNFWKKYHPGMTLEQEQQVYYAVIARKDCPEDQIYPGVGELIKKLKTKEIRMAVLSSDPPRTIFSEIKKYGLEDMFSEVLVDMHDKSVGMQKLVNESGFNPEETVFIGDSNHEIEVGRQAGTKTLAVTWGFCSENRLKSKKPDFLAHNIKELEEILLS